jgi:hypothetical protein
MQEFNVLTEFVDKAVRNRKYPVGTAHGLKAALKLFELELHEDERGSLDKFKQNIDQIYKVVISKNGKTFTVASLATYKSRVLKVISDYDKYGQDPAKMVSWSPKVIARARRSESQSDPLSGESVSAAIGIAADMHKIELALRPGAPKFMIIVARDPKPEEVSIMISVLKSLTATTNKEPDAADESDQLKGVGGINNG